MGEPTGLSIIWRISFGSAAHDAALFIDNGGSTFPRSVDMSILMGYAAQRGRICNHRLET